nr:TOC34 (TOC34) [Polytomella parva]|eukprot:CAMPEP_0175040072 /NCGR_PEP_ID=MMETSP0052_2-20121109/1027_1 /TAXON_ID=51329 ORGANISM="Polytomella parva, Strain SAG 63-3" /NCGR_SAMPLE_ID=MMETSP0052_2 /ASSEMBLY_ACC=CAM_ASM_000194 /LENGTH=383 /DNA_ID=CAMNT_0016302177 /DNA_START=29 /DNA_END=1180 /DNA_ORIENTATION=-
MSRFARVKEEEEEVEVEEGEEVIETVVEDEDIESADQDEEITRPWEGLRKFQEKAEILNAIRRLKAAGRNQLSILLIGRQNVGKSSTVNSLLGEVVAQVQPIRLQPDPETVSLYVREVSIRDPSIDGFKIKIYDTCGLEDPESGDYASYEALQAITERLRGRSIDVVLYTDRLDLYRVDPLHQTIMRAFVDAFGKRILDRTALLLTHAHLPQTPPGTTFDSFRNRRVSDLRRALAAPPPIPIPFIRSPALPAFLAEHAPHCPVSPRRRRVLPDGTEWVAALYEGLADVALSQGNPYRYHPKYTRDPSQKLGWLLPVVVLAQIVLYRQFLGPYINRQLDDHYISYRKRIEKENEEGRKMKLPDIKVPEEDDFWRMQSGQSQQQE